MSNGRTEIERTIRDEGSITRAAKALGASRRTLQNRMRAYGIPRGRAGRPRKPFRRRASIARVKAWLGKHQALVGGAVAVAGVAALVRWKSA